MKLSEIRAQAREWHRIVRSTCGQVSEHIAEADMLVQAMGYSAQGTNAADWQAMMQYTHFAARWADFGYPAFYLSHSLAAKLVLTDCSKVAYGELKWPFDSFMVVLPQPSLLTMTGVDTAPVAVQAVQFHRYRSPAGEPGLYVAAIDEETTSVHRSIREADAERDVEEFLLRETTPETVSLLGAGVEFSDLDSTALQASLRIVANLALYLADLRALGQWSAEQPNMGIGAREAKRKQPLTERSWQLGNEIKLSPELRHAASNQVQTSTQWQLDARFLVRGHWRNQPYGEGRQLRRRQWIDPFWKGPEAGHRLVRDYTLDEEKT